MKYFTFETLNKDVLAGKSLNFYFLSFLSIFNLKNSFLSDRRIHAATLIYVSLCSKLINPSKPIIRSLSPSLSFYLTHTLSHTHTLSLSVSRSHKLSLPSTKNTWSKVTHIFYRSLFLSLFALSRCLEHRHTHPHTHAHTLSHTHASKL